MYKERRDFKTSPQQWKIVMDFVEEYPMLLKSHLTNSGDSSRIATLWEELARRLNSMGFGERSVGKWKVVRYTKTFKISHTLKNTFHFINFNIIM